MKRHVQLIHVRPEKRDEYLRLHAAVWPQVEERLTASNITNYSIFIRDDLLIAYFESRGGDFERDCELIAADPTTRQWWQLTDPCQIPVSGAEPGTLWADADELWHLD